MNTDKLMDFYEITMAYSDMKNGKGHDQAYFDVFFRKSLDNGGYNVAGGLDEVINYIQNLSFDKSDIEYLRSFNMFDEDFLTYLANFKFTGDISAIPDGTVVFPGEPCITVRANIVEAKLIETDLLNRFNHGSLISTRASRIVQAAKGKSVLEFGARRAQGKDAAIAGAKHAYVGGCVGTSCYAAAKKYQIPLLGTMAHSHVMAYDSEYEAFVAYAKTFPNNSIFLVDTFDTLNSGVPNAIRVAQDYLIPNGYKLKGIRLDSGDLVSLSKGARQLLDAAGMYDTQISVSNSLDEYKIDGMLMAGAPIDAFGVGENLITSKNDPVFGGVYKLAAIGPDTDLVPKMKISDTLSKSSNPGYKKVYRLYDQTSGIALADVVALSWETVTPEQLAVEAGPFSQPFDNYEVRELQVPVFKDGVLVYAQPSLKARQTHCAQELSYLPDTYKDLYQPGTYPVYLSKGLSNLKQGLMERSSENNVNLARRRGAHHA